jgi:predicted metalloendopeptidase
MSCVNNSNCQCRLQDDFYNHINDKWFKDPQNEIPKEYSRWGGFVKLQDECLKNQINLVKNLDNKSDKDENKILAIWEASKTRFLNWETNQGDYLPLSDELMKLNEYLPEILNNVVLTHSEDNVVKLADYLYYTQISGIRNIFDFDVGSNLENSNNVVLDFGTCGTSLPSREYYMDTKYEAKREMFKKHLENVKNLLEQNNIKLDENFVENVYDFEMILAKYKMKPEQSRQYDKYYTNTTLSDLYEKINELKSLEDKQQNYDQNEKKSEFGPAEITLAKIFFEQIYDKFDFKNRMKNNLDKNYEITSSVITSNTSERSNDHSSVLAEITSERPNDHSSVITSNTSERPNDHSSVLAENKYIINPPVVYHITAYDGDAIRRLLKILFDKSNYAKYRSFMQYKTICAFKGFCTKEIDDEYFDFYSRKLSGQAEQKSEEKRSIQLVNAYAGELMGKIYVAKYFPESSKNDVSKMIKDILITMNNSLLANDWLTEPTKIKALDKLKKFNIKIGFPDVWKDYTKFDIKIGDSLYEISKKAKEFSLEVNFYNKINSVVDKNEWHMTPHTVNAYFSPTENEIVFPAAILQPPFYCSKMTDIDFDFDHEKEMLKMLNPDYDFTLAANLGGIGAVIAHEITHGYDDNGRKFDADGNLKDWWTPEDVSLFNNKIDLMTEQTEKYKFIDIEDNNKEYHLNAQLTMGENLADLGGLSLSLKTLISKLEKLNKDEIEANQRVLFKSFANIWKEHTKKDHKINAMSTDPHAPSEFRANLVKNMDEFYDVFNVLEDDDMYISKEKRLRMW